MLAEAYHLQHVSSGDLLRAQIQAGSELGREAAQFIQAGQFVPDMLVTTLVLDSLSGINQSWLLDGFPRTLAQAEQLVAQFDIDHVINLDVPVPELIERTALRYIHAPSGRTYHLKFNPPKVAGIDDITNEPLVQREDDKREVVQKRLELYTAQTEPLLDFFASKNLLLNFPGNNSHELFAEIKQVLDRAII